MLFHNQVEFCRFANPLSGEVITAKLTVANTRQVLEFVYDDTFLKPVECGLPNQAVQPIDQLIFSIIIQDQGISTR